jgi:hypothetical protein
VDRESRNSQGFFNPLVRQPSSHWRAPDPYDPADISFLTALFALLAATAWGSGDFTGGLAARRFCPCYASAAHSPSLPSVAVDTQWILGVAGTLFFLLATRAGRLDIAAVLGSLYPAATAVLAKLITKESIARLQVVGMAVAVLAVALMTI